VACYDREFLVPYLKNLYALELLKMRTDSLRDWAKEEMARLERDASFRVTRLMNGNGGKTRSPLLRLGLSGVLSSLPFAKAWPFWCTAWVPTAG
jgi:hypothetical protein